MVFSSEVMKLWPLHSEDSKCHLSSQIFKVEVTSRCTHVCCDGGVTLGTLGAITTQTDTTISNSYNLDHTSSSHFMIPSNDIHLPKQLHVLILVITSSKHLSLLCIPTSTYSKQSPKYMPNICFNQLSLEFKLFAGKLPS